MSFKFKLHKIMPDKPISKKSIGTIVANTLIGLVLAIFIWQRVPESWRMFQMQNQASPNFQVSLLNGEIITVPQENKRYALFFWATWCGPCSVELRRVQDLIDESKIPVENVLAISSHEDLQTVQAAVKERGYSFSVAVDEQGAIAGLFGVKATPTIVFIDEKGFIDWMSMGVSPTLSFRLKSFLN